MVDVWLYSTQEMLEHEYKEDIPSNPPPENDEMQEDRNMDTESQNHIDSAVTSIGKDIEDISSDRASEINNTEKLNDSWLEFFSKDSTQLNVDEMLVKDVKKKAMSLNDKDHAVDGNFVVNKSVEPKFNESLMSDLHMREMDDFRIGAPTEQLPTEILSQGSCVKKRIMKYMDPTTRKIYYLEMDRDLDLSKVQEIVINSQGQVKTAKISPIKSNGLKHVRKVKGGISLLQPEIKSLLKRENNNVTHSKLNHCYSHIENDHCYLATPRANLERQNDDLSMDNRIIDNVHTSEENLFKTLCAVVLRFPCVRMAVNYLLKKIPLITVKAKDQNYVKNFPFVVESEERYWKLDFAKRRNIEVCNLVCEIGISIGCSSYRRLSLVLWSRR